MSLNFRLFDTACQMLSVFLVSQAGSVEHRAWGLGPVAAEGLGCQGSFGGFNWHAKWVRMNEENRGFGVISSCLESYARAPLPQNDSR